MQLSDLLGVSVLDAPAGRLGTVTDARLAVRRRLRTAPIPRRCSGSLVSPRTQQLVIWATNVPRSAARRCWRRYCAPATITGTFPTLWTDLHTVGTDRITARRLSPLRRRAA